MKISVFILSGIYLFVWSSWIWHWIIFHCILLLFFTDRLDVSLLNSTKLLYCILNMKRPILPSNPSRAFVSLRVLFCLMNVQLSWPFMSFSFAIRRSWVVFSIWVNNLAMYVGGNGCSTFVFHRQQLLITKSQKLSRLNTSSWLPPGRDESTFPGSSYHILISITYSVVSHHLQSSEFSLLD